MNRRRAHRTGGFTLAETLAAGVILAISAAMIGLAVRQGARAQTTARNAQHAAQLLDCVLAKIDTIGPARLIEEGPTEGAFEAPYEDFAWTATIETEDLTGYLYTVTVRVTWHDPTGRQKSADVQTLLNDPPGSHKSRLEWEDL